MAKWPWRNPPNTQFRLNRDSFQARGLLAWWPSIGQNGNVVRDYSGRGIHAPVNGGVSIVGNPVIGRMFSFNGTDGWIDIAAMAAPARPFTLSFWVQAPAPTANFSVFDSAPSNANVFRVLQNYSQSRAEWWSDNPGFDLGLSANTLYKIDLLVSFSTTRSISYYRNGVFVSTNTGDTTSTLAWTNPRFGSLNLGSFFNGYLGDIRFRNRLLSAGEIWQEYSPQGRWDLYEPVLSRRVYLAGDIPAADGFGQLLSTSRNMLVQS